MSNAKQSDIQNKFNNMLAVMVKEKASDIYLRSDHQPYLRIEGDVLLLEVPPISAQEMHELVVSLLRSDQLERFDRKQEENIMYVTPELGRFRINIYMQKNALAMVIRKIREDISSFGSLGLPAKLESLCMMRSGLVLVTGPTGSGKSTTLASMVKYRNSKSTGHILTIEDPVEFVHDDINCIISQREVGIDTRSFSDALESAVRQAPDVLLIGEMRDVESVKAGMYFAETGHLVLGTLHANNAIQTIERLLQFFPPSTHMQILQAMSINLKAVLAQRLLKHKDNESRVPAYELMVINARMRDLLSNSNLSQMARELDLFHPEGMISFDICLINLLKQGKITLDSCIAASDNPNDLRLKIRQLGIKA